MNNKPFISIITASFNNEKTIRNTIDSISNQTFKAIEHIIIDNRSSDSTIDIIKELEGCYNLKWISEPDDGISDAINKGLKLSKGKYILIIHADDRLIKNDIFDTILPSLIDEKYDIVSYPIVLNISENEKIYFTNKPLWLIYFKTIIRHQGAFIHKRLHDRIGNYDKSYSVAMDYDFFYRAKKNKASIKLGNFPIAEMGSSGISANDSSLLTRMEENYAVQRANEHFFFWVIFQFLYFYYKKYIRHLIRKSFKNPNKV